MKILFTSDTHVDPDHLNRLLKAAAQLRPEAAIIGGDIIPDWRHSIRESIGPHRVWVRNSLVPQIRHFREKHPDIRVFLDFGNDDIAAARPFLEEQEGTDFFLLHMKVVDLGKGLGIGGYMCVNPTPFGIKDWEKPDCRDRDGLSEPGVRRKGTVTHSGVEFPYYLDRAGETIEDDLDRLSHTLESPPRRDMKFIFVSHAPPKDTALDLTSRGFHVGSLAVRRFIERWGATGRLLASLHGHIHESPMESGYAWQHVGRVPCFNVGQQRRTLRALLFDTENPEDSARLVLTDSSGVAKVSGKGDW